MLSQMRVQELLSYDAQSGVLTWRVARVNHVQAGAVAGSRNPRGYVTVGIDGRIYRAHRVAWLYAYGSWPKDQIDHINGDKSDNRLVNLRDVTHRTNQENMPAIRRSGKLLGTHFNKRHKKWLATINVDSKVLRLGNFGTEQEAHAAYLKAKRELHAGCTI